MTKVNVVFSQLNLPTLDPDHVAHLSIGWLDIRALPRSQIDDVLNFQIQVPDVRDIIFKFSCAKLKVGRKIYEIQPGSSPFPPSLLH